MPCVRIIASPEPSQYQLTFFSKHRIDPAHWRTALLFRSQSVLFVHGCHEAVLCTAIHVCYSVVGTYSHAY